jgi:hypothetical protein
VKVGVLSVMAAVRAAKSPLCKTYCGTT